MSKFKVLAASLVALPILALTSVALAAGLGQTEGGDIYRVRNVTANSAFVDNANAKCNETVQFKVRIHNPGPSRIDNVTVVATLPNVVATSHTSKVTVSSPYADPESTSDTTSVTLDKAGKLTYLAGTTELLDANGTKMSTLGDTITSTGVKVTGGVGVSINEKRFVQFQAKVTCETPQAPTYSCNVLEVKTGSNRTVTITGFRTSAANGAQFRRADINWGDNSSVLQSANPVGATHQYAADGTYNIRATAVFVVNGQEVTATSAGCAKQVTFKTEVTKITVCELSTKKIITINEKDFDAAKHSKDLSKCETPGKITVCELATKKVVSINEADFDSAKYSKDLTKCETPEVLVNTGTGSLLGIFAAVTVAGAVAHRLVWRRFNA